MTAAPMMKMNDGNSIPQLGLGVFQVDPSQTTDPVTHALNVGYRMIDTAQGYNNEEGVGKAVAASSLPRSEIFVTTKLANANQGSDKAMPAFDESLDKLGMDYVDLFLIHWPQPMFDQYVDTWKALEKIKAEGRAKSIGVSNFTPEHLQRLFDETEIVPVLNQIELHPWMPQNELRAFHAQHNILTQAWSPIGRGRGILEEKVVTDIAQATGKTPAQVVLRWHVQLGNNVIPKSVTPSRIEENLNVFDFELSNDDMAQLASLDNGTRIGPDPQTFDAR